MKFRKTYFKKWEVSHLGRFCMESGLLTVSVLLVFLPKILTNKWVQITPSSYSSGCLWDYVITFLFLIWILLVIFGCRDTKKHNLVKPIIRYISSIEYINNKNHSSFRFAFTSIKWWRHWRTSPNLRWPPSRKLTAVRRSHPADLNIWQKTSWNRRELW